MLHRVYIQDMQTSEVRVCQIEFGRNNPHGMFDDVDNYLWNEGNYACDCNRALFFARAGGEDDPNRKCGGERYRVICIIDPDGLVVYAEAEQKSAEWYDGPNATGIMVRQIAVPVSISGP